MIRNISLLYNTIKYLRPIQILFQIKYRVVKPKPLRKYFQNNYCGRTILQFRKYPPILNTWDGESKFIFLNISLNFNDFIDWNYQMYGKLWNYNLQYLGYILQNNVSEKRKIELVSSLYECLSSGKIPLEPYPASLRIMNMIKWFSSFQPGALELESKVYGEIMFLSKRLEYHILGNHLLENAFAIIMGGAYFNEQKWIRIGKDLLLNELDEQILDDGAHFELSPMYHQIIFFRLLELIDWYSSWSYKDLNFEKFLRAKAFKMQAWLKNLSFRNGDIPHFNDSANGIAYSTEWLMDYSLEILGSLNYLKLGTSGYRSFEKEIYECKVDCAQIGPTYQSGHGHADALSFIVYFNGEPVFVEQGTSTYQINMIREEERSTKAHNTVVVNNENQSTLWKGFRVAKRAMVSIIKENESELWAEHDGYKNLDLIHRREFHFGNNYIKITDLLFGNDKLNKKFYLHLHPTVEIVEIRNDLVLLNNGVNISFIESENSIEVEKYNMSDGYNKHKQGDRISVSFKKRLNTIIYFKG